MMDERKTQLMKRVVDAYISTAHPVGSRVLVARYRLSWSSATIRNELSLLEEAGYMFQPYTSAGRIPTHLAYRRYYEDMKATHLAPGLERSLQRMAVSLSSLDDIRELCKVLSHLASEIVFCVSSLGHVSAGMRFFADKPERDDSDFVRDITISLDVCDEIIERIAHDITGGVHAYIGDEDTFGASCSALVVRVTVGDDAVFIGILGPLRMNYQKNIALLQTLVSNE